MESISPVVPAYAVLNSLPLVLLLTSVTYASRLATIVLSHFLLDLRHTATRLTINHSTHNNSLLETSNVASSPSELHFGSHVLGDLGGSLSFGSDNDVEIAEGPDEVSEEIGEERDTLESA